MMWFWLQSGDDERKRTVNIRPRIVRIRWHTETRMGEWAWMDSVDGREKERKERWENRYERWERTDWEIERGRDRDVISPKHLLGKEGKGEREKKGGVIMVCRNKGIGPRIGMVCKVIENDRVYANRVRHRVSVQTLYLVGECEWVNDWNVNGTSGSWIGCVSTLVECVSSICVMVVGGLMSFRWWLLMLCMVIKKNRYTVQE